MTYSARQKIKRAIAGVVMLVIAVAVLLVLSAEAFAGTDAVKINSTGTTTLTVTNVGGVSGAEVEVLYSDGDQSADTLLQPGESVTITATTDTTVVLSSAMRVAMCERPPAFSSPWPVGVADGVCYVSAPVTTVEITSSAGSVSDIQATAGTAVRVPEEEVTP